MAFVAPSHGALMDTSTEVSDGQAARKPRASSAVLIVIWSAAESTCRRPSRPSAASSERRERSQLSTLTSSSASDERSSLRRCPAAR